MYFNHIQRDVERLTENIEQLEARLIVLCVAAVASDAKELPLCLCLL